MTIEHDQERPVTTHAPVWRSLEDKARSPEQRMELAAAERDAHAPDVEALSLGRRGFLTLSGATAAAVGLAGCIRRPAENILPYTRGVEHVVPGVPMHFATAIERRGDVLGLLVTSHEGRPTKIEGNPEHPSSLGATDLWAQATVLDVYDGDRSKGPARGGGGSLTGFSDVRTGWRELEAALRARLEEHDADGGRGLRFLVQPTVSPTFRRIRDEVVRRFPQARFHVYTSVNESNAREGGRIAFGQPVTTLHRLEEARIVLALDSDFLHTEAGAVRNARGFAHGRRLTSAADGMNRLYVVEPGFSSTGATADHRLRLPASRVGDFLRAVARRLVDHHRVELGGVAQGVGTPSVDGLAPGFGPFVDAVAQDLADNAGYGPILVGARQPAAVHALAHAINSALRNAGRTVFYAPVTDLGEPDQVRDLADLTEGMKSGEVKTLLILGGNPAYDAPADLDFGTALGEVEFSLHLSSHRDETSTRCSWHGNRAHDLETWGDLRAHDGTVSIQQPLIAPLWGGRSDVELLAIAANARNWRGHSVVRRTMQLALPPGMSLERIWRRSLHAGFVGGTAGRPASAPPLQEAAIAQALRERGDGAQPTIEALEYVFAPCDRLYDGRYANNPWLLELPSSLTKLSWDNAALLSPATASELGVSLGDMIEIRSGDHRCQIPVAVLPGHADYSITLSLGWGRGEIAGAHARTDELHGGGFDVGTLRTTDAFWIGAGATVRRGPRTHFMAVTQEHGSMVDMLGHDRPIAIEGTLAEYKERPDFPAFRAVDMVQDPLPSGSTRPPPGAPLWISQDYSRGHQWGMVIDLTSCTGCNACAIACQAENNVPTVGKRHIARGREMYWLRIDRYFVGEDQNEPGVAMQPLGCMQCEQAPCENVCPVNATSHTPEGLNDMAYNRCIGTRYCGANCPYKVRRFNFLSYHPGTAGLANTYHDLPEIRRMQFNPNVTVRMRGVMEKCSYCVQRIQEAKISARRDDRPVADGDVEAACAQACPTRAITFGDKNGYPHIVRKGSRLIGMTVTDLAREVGLSGARIERDGEPVDAVEAGDTIFSASALAQVERQDRRYRVLEELGVMPRTVYLAKIRNSNEALSPAGRAAEEAEG